MCTDGLANIGLGALDTEENVALSKDFYEEIATIAKEKSLLISVITIKGEGCKMEILGKLSNLTNGNVLRINPENIAKDFSSILANEIVGMDVSFDVRLYKGLRFRNENAECLKENGSVCKREIGNATIKTEVFFYYYFLNI